MKSKIFIGLIFLGLFGCNKVEKVTPINDTVTVVLYEQAKPKEHSDALIKWTLMQGYSRITDNSCDCNYYFKTTSEPYIGSVIIIDENGITKYDRVKANCIEHTIEYPSKSIQIDSDGSISKEYDQGNIVATTTPRRIAVFNILCNKD